MRLRSFTAPNMAEAIRKVRAEFGADAIIVSSQYRGPGLGVQVTAAYERDPLAELMDDEAQIPAAPVPRGPQVPTAAAVVHLALENPGPENPTLAGPAAAPSAGGRRTGRAKPAAARDKPAEAGGARAEEVADLEGIEDPLDFGTALSTAIDKATPGIDPHRMLTAAEDLARVLAWHGVPMRLNERLTLGAAAVGLAEPERALAESLAQAFRFVPVPATPQRPIILIGPHGGGKTLTCAKLAARAVISGIQVTVVSADTARAGAVAQLSTFVDLLRQPMVTVETPEQMSRAVDRARASGPVFIDTPGINPFDAREVAELKAYVDAAAGDAVTVLAAGGDPAEAAELAAIFAGIGARQLIGTRLDASRRYGALLAAGEDSRLRLADLSLTPYVAEGLQPATARLLARLLLRDPEDPDVDAIGPAP